MAIAKNPKRSADAVSEREANAFISGAGKKAEPESNGRKKPMMIRIDPDMIPRIAAAAKRLGLSKTGFIVSSVAERLERMEESR